MTLGQRLQSCDRVAYLNGPRQWLAFWNLYHSGVEPEEALRRLDMPVPSDNPPKIICGRGEIKQAAAE